jgi:nucleoside-diphosphate-sugar epimerase
LRDKPFILVTGATGAVGPRVVAALLEYGCRVRTFSLDAPPDQWPDGVDAQIGDITDPAAVQLAMQGVNAVIHLAALLHIVNPPPEMRKKYERINIGGTAIVVDAAIRAGVSRVVLFSTIAVYGASTGSVLTEASPLRPDSFYAQTKMDAERIVLSAKREDGTPMGTVLRLGAVYGPRIKGNYQRLVQSLARGRFVPVGDGANRRTLVYDRDVARAAVTAAIHNGAAGEIFNVSDGHFHTMNEIVKTIYNALGRNPPWFALPELPVRWAAGLLEGSCKLLGRSSPVTRGTIDKYMEDIAVDSQLIQTVLGFAPQYDLAMGWKETIQEMRRGGNL